MNPVYRVLKEDDDGKGGKENSYWLILLVGKVEEVTIHFQSSVRNNKSIILRDVFGSTFGRDDGWTTEICFPQASQTNARIEPQIGHNRFLPNPSQFIVFYHPNIRLYVIQLLRAS
jgi:hypothetical protein